MAIKRLNRPAGRGRSGDEPSDARVFISHSHADRGFAAELDLILRKHQAATFFDQAEIEAGDSLPDRLRQGIAWCNSLLLLWSASARQSRWVDQEWNLAYDSRKKIVPYLLDSSLLPDALGDRVYIEADDRQRGNGQLLKAIFGRIFTPPDPSQIFPGRWQASLAVAGLGAATYDMDLRPNGQIVGTAKMEHAGVFGQLAHSSGLGHLLDMQGRLRGEWTYDDVAKALTLDITAELLGQTQREVIRISTVGSGQRGLQGLDGLGRPWMVQRVS
jgi:hypothetical protein